MSNEKISKQILGLTVEMQFAGKPYNVDGKSGVTQDSISIKKGKSYIKIDPVEFLGILAVEKDKTFMQEVNKRASVQSNEIRQYLPK